MEAYRVRKQFQWDGWYYAPKGPSGECRCGCPDCTHMVGSSCRCGSTYCRCDCGIKQEMYAGDIWMVADGHPRKEHIINHHFATYDAGLPSIDELKEREEYKRLLSTDTPGKGRKGRVAV